MIDLQRTIFHAVQARGYAQGDLVAETRLQLLKALEELGECARFAFDGRAILARGLADVVIPLLVIAQLQGDDLLATVLAKAQDDVARGRRAG